MKPLTLFRRGLVVAISGLAAAAGVLSAAGLETFEEATVGRAPAGWTVAVSGEGEGRWTVEKAEGAPRAGQVLRQSGRVPRPSYPLAIKDEPRLRDGFVEVKFRAVSGEIDQAAGVVWRCRDARNYYICRANALENNAVLYKVVEGKRQALDIVGRKGGYGVETPVAPDRWQTLRVEFKGPRAVVWFEGKRLFAVEDTTLAEAGRVGLWTKADSVMLFDDFAWGEATTVGE